MAADIGKWEPRGPGNFEALERALAEVVHAWLDTAGYPVPKNSAGATLTKLRADAKRLFETCRQEHPKDVPYHFIRELGIDSLSLDETAHWSKLLGSRLRRTAQEMLRSGVMAETEFEPAGRVVIVGAGASVHAGLPLGSSILRHVIEELQSGTFGESYEEMLKLEVLAPLTNDRDGDFEQLLSALQVIAWEGEAYRRPIQSAERWIRDLILAYRNVIRRFEDEGYTQESRAITSRFIRLLGDTNSDRWAIISFNQDTVIETELFATGVWKQMDPEDRKNPKNPEMGGYGLLFDYDDPPLGRIPNQRIYKPHGSLAWVRSKDWKRNYDIKMRDVEIDWSAFERSNRRPVSSGSPIIAIPSFLKSYDDELYWHTIAKIIYELRNAHTVTVIGFRLRPDDTLISNIIKQALRLNASRNRKIEIVAPLPKWGKPDLMDQGWLPFARELEADGWEVSRIWQTFKEYTTMRDSAVYQPSV